MCGAAAPLEDPIHPSSWLPLVLVIHLYTRSLVKVGDDGFYSSADPLSNQRALYLSPRLRILYNIPFAIPFDVRVAILREFVDNDKRNLVEAGIDSGDVFKEPSQLPNGL
ncbi:hypothetical protein HETIRDRAFT_451078 [Heterobasidion irregulare TC 32-1]|uniref:Uncharacterized protein n=1 Tax=Heterobasidion irregulare (strain TC 32-1) TaxID=747525 RepID=W4K844_HETIT|nr:uncharacterized protein HETIRDRAFT_451078 [Heterobasidion irregulare TC 32-1]ETW81236.1 hypothetical protein HETIRDRAFT_451078 [Heterobasidion irregulare TC 32-1]